MQEQKPTIEQILKMMSENPGEEPRPMVLMSKVLPEWITGSGTEICCERSIVLDEKWPIILDDFFPVN